MDQGGERGCLKSPFTISFLHPRMEQHLQEMEEGYGGMRVAQETPGLPTPCIYPPQGSGILPMPTWRPAPHPIPPVFSGYQALVLLSPCPAAQHPVPLFLPGWSACPCCPWLCLGYPVTWKRLSEQIRSPHLLSSLFTDTHGPTEAGGGPGCCTSPSTCSAPLLPLDLRLPQVPQTSLHSSPH